MTCQKLPGLYLWARRKRCCLFVISRSFQLLKATLQPKKHFLSSVDICQRRETLVIGSRPGNACWTIRCWCWLVIAFFHFIFGSVSVPKRLPWAWIWNFNQNLSVFSVLVTSPSLLLTLDSPGSDLCSFFWMFSQFNIHSGHILEKNARLLSRVISKIRCCLKTKAYYSSQLQGRRYSALQCLIRSFLFFSQPYEHSTSLKIILWHPSDDEGAGTSHSIFWMLST